MRARLLSGLGRLVSLWDLCIGKGKSKLYFFIGLKSSCTIKFLKRNGCNVGWLEKWGKEEMSCICVEKRKKSILWMVQMTEKGGINLVLTWVCDLNGTGLVIMGWVLCNTPILSSYIIDVFCLFDERMECLKNWKR